MNVPPTAPFAGQAGMGMGMPMPAGPGPGPPMPAGMGGFPAPYGAPMAGQAGMGMAPPAMMPGTSSYPQAPMMPMPPPQPQNPFGTGANLGPTGSAIGDILQERQPWQP